MTDSAQTDTPKTYTGACLCGAVRYSVQAPPVVVAQCHCAECRKISGAGHSTGAMFPRTALSLQGDISTFSYTSGAGNTVTKSFCPGCGCPIMGQNTGMPDHVTLTLGSMDNADDLAVQVVIFGRDRPSWDQAGRDAACFETQPGWAPENGI
jgi:hypothetical protein